MHAHSEVRFALALLYWSVVGSLHPTVRFYWPASTHSRREKIRDVGENGVVPGQTFRCELYDIWQPISIGSEVGLGWARGRPHSSRLAYGWFEHSNRSPAA
jgi:hypothetical protein